MTLMSVDLPAPFSPSNACTSPACKSKDTPLSARTAPKDFVTDESWRSVFNCGKQELRNQPTEARQTAVQIMGTRPKSLAKTNQPPKFSPRRLMNSVLQESVGCLRALDLALLHPRH